MSGFLARLRAVLGDPLYRWESRRSWGRRRCLCLGLAVAAWGAIVLNWLWPRWAPPAFGDPGLVGILLLGRLPLAFAASTATALCIAPERVSGQLEQFVLTPMDPWRFGLARLAGCMRGPALVWLGLLLTALGALLAAGIMAGWRAATMNDGGFVPGVWTDVPVFAALQLDLAVMLALDGVVGMRFSTTSSSPMAALFKTYLATLVIIPATMWFCALFAGGIAVVLADGVFRARLSIADWRVLTLMELVRLGLGASVVRTALRDARAAIQKTFYQPEGHG